MNTYKSITLAFAALAAFNIGLAATTVHTIGDSTVAIWPSGYYPKTGWGEDLHFFFDPTKVIINDQAVSGSSSKSFYDNFWPQVKTTIKPGDFVTIQFGINDAKTDTAFHTDPFTTFESYLTKFCNETKALGAHPILVTTVNRNSWQNGVIYPAYHDYPIATRDLAASLKIPLIDLDKLEGALRTSLGETYSIDYLSMVFPAGDWPNYPNGSNDTVHFQESGAIELDNLVIQAIEGLSSDPNVSKLIPAILPRYKIEVKANNSALGMVTRTQYVPAGIRFTLLAVPQAGHTFTGWTGSVTSSKAITQFTVGAYPKSIVGNFK